MKANAAVLYPNEQVTIAVTEYSAQNSTSLPKHITDYHAHIAETKPDTANYMISDFQAQNHIWLAKLIGAKRGRP